MTFLLTLVTIIQSFSISLGVGASTLAIVNFFAAIADGTIDATERRMMGIVYIVLRIAMVVILLSTLFLIFVQHGTGNLLDLSAYTYGQITVLVVLYLNALFMTLRWMPSTFGPAIQAGSWYTLGTLMALLPLGLTDFSYIQFVMGYITWVVLAISIVNGTMAIMKHQREEKEGSL